MKTSLDFFWPKHSLSLENFNHFDKKEQSSVKNSIKINDDVNSIKLKKQDCFNDEDTKKASLLSILKGKMMSDTNIVFSNQCNNFVFSDGNINSNLMLIGEAPGEEEDLQGIPFVGRSGQLLRFFLKEAKINDIYITNIIPWRPPNNRTPTIQEISFMQPYIFQHIKIINPKIIVVIGTTSLKALNINQTITKAQGNLFETEIGKIYPIYHPSYALRVSAKKKDLWLSLLKLKSLLSQF